MIEKLHIYTRVSTDVQEVEGTSLSTQKELGIGISKIITKGKYKIWNEGSSSSSSDSLDNRPVLMELLSNIEKGDVR